MMIMLFLLLTVALIFGGCCVQISPPTGNHSGTNNEQQSVVPLVTKPEVIAPYESLTSFDASQYVGASFFENKRVLHIGDSQVAGPYGVSLGEMIIDPNIGKASFYHRHGEVGKGVVWWLEGNRLRNLIRIKRPDIVIVTMGGNDAWIAKYRTEKYKSLVQELLDVIKEGINDPYRNFIWVMPPTAVGISSDRQPDRDNVCNVLIQVLHENNMQYVDSRNLTNSESISPLTGRTVRGIHFTRRGGQQWAILQYNAIINHVIAEYQ